MRIPVALRRGLQKIVGKNNVRSDEISCLLHAYDCSLSRVRPDLFVHLTDAACVAPVVQLLNRYRVPFVARGAATNHAGSCTPLKGGAVLNLAGLNRLLEINTKEGYAVAEPGVITARLQQALDPLGFFYAPDPASQRACTLGGNIAQNASGSRCLKYGGTLDHVLEISLVLPDGQPVTLSRTDSGPDWIGLLTGSEGTLGIITRLKVKILPKPACIQTYLVTFPSLEDCVEAVTGLISDGILPRCMEAMDQLTLRTIEEFSHAGYPTQAHALLILELDGTVQEVSRQKEKLETVCLRHKAQQFISAENEQERQRLWAGRRAAYSAMARLAPNVLVCDGTVPRSALPDTLRKVRRILDENNIRAGLLFHAGDGNFHPQLIFDARNPLETKRIYQTVRRILQACVEAGGTLSGEHGIGVEKRGLMAYQYDKNTLHLFAQIKQAFDPAQLANPLKIIPLNYQEQSSAPVPPDEPTASFRQAFTALVAQHKPFFITGSDKLSHGKAPCLSTRELNQILDIDLHNYTVTAQAGVTLQELAEALHKKQVYCVLPEDPEITLGGAFSSGCFPAFYQEVTGLQAILPDGRLIRYGGKLTKNAAGYNLIRLFAGARGAFGAVTELTFKISATKPPVLDAQPQQPLEENKLFCACKEVLDPEGLLLVLPEEQTP